MSYHKAPVLWQLVVFDPLTGMKSSRGQGHARFSIVPDSCTGHCALQHGDYELQPQTCYVCCNLGNLFVIAMNQ